MTPEKTKKVKQAGFEVGDAKSFLKLTPNEAKRVEVLRAGNKRVL